MTTTTGPKIAAVTVSHSPLMVSDGERQQGLRFRDGVERVKSAIAAFDPTLVVFFGPDHVGAFGKVTPCFLTVESAEGIAEWDLPGVDYDVPRDHAVALGDHLIASGVDVAVAARLQLDHGFGLSMKDLFGSLTSVPVLPIVINCIDRPLATLSRTASLGAAVGDYLRQNLSASDRVLVVGSGGISHAPPTQPPGADQMTEDERQAVLMAQLEGAADAINPEWDTRFLARLAGPEWRELAELTNEDIAQAGSGAAEVRTWVAAAFAGGEPLTTVAYESVPEWITGMGIAASDTLLKGQAPDGLQHNSIHGG